MTGNYKIVRKYRKLATMTSAESIDDARTSLESFTGKLGQYFIHYPGYARLQEPGGPPPGSNPTIVAKPATPEEKETIKTYLHGPKSPSPDLDKDFVSQERTASAEEIGFLQKDEQFPEAPIRKVGTGERKEVFTRKWSPGRHNENQHRPGGGKTSYRTIPTKDSDDL